VSVASSLLLLVFILAAIVAPLVGTYFVLRNRVSRNLLIALLIGVLLVVMLVLLLLAAILVITSADAGL
jgi:hypothetical protein